MKLIYHHRIASKDGQYVHVEEIIKALRAQGHEIIVVAPQVAEKAEFGSDGGWVSKLRSNLPKFTSELLEFGYAFYVFFKLCAAIIKHRPDGIYERYNLFLPAGIWAKKIFGLKLLLEVNSPLYDERKKYGGIALDMLAKWSEYYTWRNADHVLPVTHVLAGFISKAGVPKERISVIPNGIDPARFNATEENKHDDAFHNKLTIGFVGFCREWHRLDEVMTLIANENNPELMFLIIGDGPVSEQLKQQAKKLNIEDNFHITGLVEREDMPYWLDQIDIAIQPAVTPWASPLKLIEYLAKGKAIVAPDTPNIKELLEDNVNAVLFDSKDTSSMIAGIRRIVNDENLRLNLQQGAKETITERKLTWRNNAERISNLFNTGQSQVKHIVFLINDITQLGGTERMCTLICNQLNQAGYQISIVSQAEENSQPFFPLDDQINRKPLFDKKPSRYQSILLPLVIAKKARSLNADLFISCDTQMCLFSSFSLLGKKHIGWEHFNSQIVTTFGSRWFGRRMASIFCKKIIVLTESDKQNWIKQLHTKESKLTVIPNPLPVARLKENLHSSEREKIVLAMGRMTEQKGFDLLIKAWATINKQSRENWKLRIVGPNGSAKPTLEQLISEYKLKNNVELVPASKQVEQEYQKASVYVLSSRYEGFGLTLIEAMGQGLPVIAFDCPMGPSEIIADIYGKLLPANNVEKLSESIEQFICDDKLREEYSQLAHERSAIYSPEKIISQWISIIQQR